MFVPFVFELYTQKEALYLWWFYQALDFAKKKNTPIIVQESYIKSPVSKYRSEGRWECDQQLVSHSYTYMVPDDCDLQYEKIYTIPSTILESIIKKHSSITDACIYLLSQEDKQLSSYILTLIDTMEATCNEKVEGIISFGPENYSLAAAGKLRGIPIIHWENGGLRYPSYLNTAYWDLDDLYGGKSVEQRWKRFCKEHVQQNISIFSKREILALLLEYDSLYLINKYDQKYKKKVGVALGYTNNETFAGETRLSDSELLYRVKEKYGAENMLVRKHPTDPWASQYPTYLSMMDESHRVQEFILECETIISMCSGVSMEAMLFNRKAITLLPCPSYFASGHDIDGEGACAGEEFLNFFFFCYLIPLEYVMDVDYLRWRLTMPSEHEIYHKHLEFYFRKKALPLSLIQKPAGDRLNAMLAEQGYHPKDVAEVERQKEEVEHKMAEQIAQREEQIAQREEEIHSLRSSVSYRVGRMITWLPRKARGGIKRLFR